MKFCTMSSLHLRNTDLRCGHAEWHAYRITVLLMNLTALSPQYLPYNSHTITVL